MRTREGAAGYGAVRRDVPGLGLCMGRLSAGWDVDKLAVGRGESPARYYPGQAHRRNHSAEGSGAKTEGTKRKCPPQKLWFLEKGGNQKK